MPSERESGGILRKFMLANGDEIESERETVRENERERGRKREKRMREKRDREMRKYKCIAILCTNLVNSIACLKVTATLSTSLSG